MLTKQLQQHLRVTSHHCHLLSATMQSLKETAVPSDIFPHVYSFLVRFGFGKSAKVFRREANVPRVVVDTPGLLDFYEAFKKRKNTIVKAPKKSAKKEVVAPRKRKADKQASKQTAKKAKKDTSSSESEPAQPVKLHSNDTKKSLTAADTSKLHSKKKKSVVTKQQEESSDSSSSDSETVAAPTKTKSSPVNDIKKPKPVVVKQKKKETSSSESSSDEPVPATSGALPKHQKILAAVKRGPESSSDDDSSDEDEPKKKTTIAAIQTNKQSSSSDSSTGDDDDKTTNPASTTPNKGPITSTPSSAAPQGKTKKSKANITPNQPFRRVDMGSSVNPKMADNSFEAKGGARGSWGEKAHHVLKNTKGRSFRHEKTKKKRGSYTGGRIDTSVHSVTFEESD